MGLALGSSALAEEKLFSTSLHLDNFELQLPQLAPKRLKDLRHSNNHHHRVTSTCFQSSGYWTEGQGSIFDLDLLPSSALLSFSINHLLVLLPSSWLNTFVTPFGFFG